MGGGESTLREVEETSFFRNTLRSLEEGLSSDSEDDEDDEPQSIYETRAELSRAQLESTRSDIERFKALLEFKRHLAELKPDASCSNTKSTQASSNDE